MTRRKTEDIKKEWNKISRNEKSIPQMKYSLDKINCQSNNEKRERHSTRNFLHWSIKRVRKIRWNKVNRGSVRYGAVLNDKLRC